MEKNRDKLLKAIQELPVYEPAQDGWNGIASRLEAQENLDRAIDNLPQYSPEEQLWSQIELGLQQVAAEEPLRKAIQQLPFYEPKEAVWKSIEAELPRQKKRNLYFMRYAAAVALLVLAVGTWWFTQQNYEVVEVVAHQEVLEVKKDWDQDEDAFEMVAAFCKQQTFVCEEPAFRNLQTELEELNEARSALKAALGDYDDSPALIAQLTDVEQQRAEVLKQMVSFI